MRSLLAALAAAALWLLAGCGPSNVTPAGAAPNFAGAAPKARAAPADARFDYFVLALSWSPAYCADRDGAGGRGDALQCESGRPFAFVVHGLWPQNERGYPADCPTSVRAVPDAVTTAMLDVMPSRGLVQHQWRKHGSCSGLAPQAYFYLTRSMFATLTIPPAYRALARPLRVTGAEVERAFLAANPGLRADGVAVQCRGGRLREVRVCFTREGAPRACGAEVDDRCDRGPVTMLPVRAGAGRG